MFSFLFGQLGIVPIGSLVEILPKVLLAVLVGLPDLGVLFGGDFEGFGVQVVDDGVNCLGFNEHLLGFVGQVVERSIRRHEILRHGVLVFA